MKQILVFSMLVLLIMACSKDVTLGKEIPADATIITLKELLANPEKYHDKEITLKGRVDGQCGNKCEFTYAENGESHTIYVGEIEAPTIQKGTPIRVTAHVFNGAEKLILTAQGFELKAKGGK